MATRDRRDEFDRIVDDQLRAEDHAKKQQAEAELVARMDQHAARARTKMFAEARKKNALYNPATDRHLFTKRGILRLGDCLPHEWQALTDAFDRMEEVGLGNSGRGWWLGPPEDKATRRGHMLRVGRGVFGRAKEKLEADEQVGHLTAIQKRLAANETDDDNLKRLPATLVALGAPMNEQASQRLIGPGKEAP